MKKHKALSALAALVILLIPAVSYAGDGPVRPGPVVTPTGQVFTGGIYHVKSKSTTKLPAGVALPDTVITLTHQPLSQMSVLNATLGKGVRYVPSAATKIKDLAFVSQQKPAALSSSGCNSLTAVAPWNWLLWAKMSQTWCYDGVGIWYWPAAHCWGYDNYPTYNYMGCSTDQIYGLGWNQGRTTWDADMCPYWIPFWGVCGWDYRIHQTYYYSENGWAWQIA